MLVRRDDLGRLWLVAFDAGCRRSGSSRFQQRPQIPNTSPAEIVLDFVEGDDSSSDQKSCSLSLRFSIKGNLHGVDHVCVLVISI